MDEPMYPRQLVTAFAEIGREAMRQSGNPALTRLNEQFAAALIRTNAHLAQYGAALANHGGPTWH